MIRVLRVGFGILAVVALVWIPVRNIGEPDFSVADYFSYFTIQSNVLGAIVLLVGGILDPKDRRWQLVRGATTLYLVITMVVYAVLLANIDVMLTDKWINDILHRLVPIVLFADWVLVPAATRFVEREVLVWLAYPAVYTAYTLIRGPIVDWYPYPFLDPNASNGVIEFVVGLVVLGTVMALLALAIGAVGRVSARVRYGEPGDAKG